MLTFGDIVCLRVKKIKARRSEPYIFASNLQISQRA